MAIPDYETLMLPLLRLTGDGEVKQFRESITVLADEFDLSQEERTELLPSGSQSIFSNRVGWAKSYMKQAGLLEFPKRGYFQITERGRDLLKEGLSRIDNSVLERYQEFNDFKGRRKSADALSGQTDEDESSSPEDQMASAYLRYQAEIERDIITSVKQVDPSFFERIVIDLLVAMGYGGNRQDAAKAVGKSSDGGIDGIINEDRLGLDVIFIQAKRWEGTVGRPEIQKFAGALQGRRAKKGVFITTSNYSKEAEDFARGIDSRIILIDGDRLAKLMIEFNIGASQVGQYQLKRIDSDYFENG